MSKGRADTTLHNYRTVTTPIGKQARLDNMIVLSDLDQLWIREVRMIHNGIGNWMHALMASKGLSRAQVLELLDKVVAEIHDA